LFEKNLIKNKIELTIIDNRYVGMNFEMKKLSHHGFHSENFSSHVFLARPPIL